MSEFCIIGSGISGSTIANLLNKKYSVILFDKARGPGGRASFKRIKAKQVLIMVLSIFHQKLRNLKNLLKI